MRQGLLHQMAGLSFVLQSVVGIEGIKLHEFKATYFKVELLSDRNISSRLLPQVVRSQAQLDVIIEIYRVAVSARGVD